MPPIRTDRIGRGIAARPGNAAAFGGKPRRRYTMHRAPRHDHARSAKAIVLGHDQEVELVGPTLGSWIWPATVRPQFARRIAKAGITALRPQPMTRSGQGGANGRSFLATAQAAGARAAAADGPTGGGYLALFEKRKPVASASPSAWLAMPALPSCITHTAGAQLCRASGRVASAVSDRDAIPRV